MSCESVEPHTNLRACSMTRRLFLRTISVGFARRNASATLSLCAATNKTRGETGSEMYALESARPQRHVDWSVRREKLIPGFAQVDT